MSETSMRLTDDIIFDTLEPIQVKVTAGGTKCILLEASGGVATRWREELLKSTKIGPDGRPSSFSGMADTEPYLISQCLYYAQEDGTLPLISNGTPDQKKLVPIQVIRGWPNRVQKALFQRAKDISDLEDKEQETEGTLLVKISQLKGKLSKLQSDNAEGREQEDSSKNSLNGTMASSD